VGVGFVICVSFGNICTCIYCVLYCLYCVFLYCFAYICVFLLVLSVLPLNDNSIMIIIILIIRFHDAHTGTSALDESG
jgi:hypothetical protein